MSQTLLQTEATTERRWNPSGDTRRAIVVCVLLVVAVAVVYCRAPSFSFLHYDDNFYVLSEPHVNGGISLEDIAWAFNNGPLGEWYPTTMLTHMLNCELFGLNPAGHHVVNVLLHALTAVGLFLVLWRMTNQPAVPATERSLVASASGGQSATFWPSAMVAGLFAVHPLHVESVAWIAELRDMLSGLFFVLTLAAYDAYVRHGESWKRYLLVAVMLALGLMAKPMLVTVPALLLLLDYWPLGRFDRAWAAGNRFPWRLVLEKLPLLALSVGDAAMTVATHEIRKDPLSIAERLSNAAISYVAYIGQSFLPIGMAIHYAHPTSGRPAWQIIGAVAVLLVITVAAVIWRRSLPFLFVGWFWYVGMLVPVSGVASVAAHARGDRYMYLPQIGLSIAIVWSLARLGAAWPMRRWIFGVAAAVVLLAFAVCAWHQTAVWQNDLTVWEHAVACEPKNPVALFNLGSWLDGNDDDAAYDVYQRAAKLEPGERDLYWWARSKALNNLGSIAARRQNRDQALADYRAAIEADPTYDPAHMNLGIQLAGRGLLKEAAHEFEECRKLSPSNTGPSWCNLAIGQMQYGDRDGAIANFRKALAADDKLVLAHMNLGVLLAERGEVDEPIAHFRRAIELDPNLAVGYQRLTGLLRRENRMSEAAKVEEQAAEAARRLAAKQTDRGMDLARQGKLSEAISQFQVAITVAPDFVKAYQQLGDALVKQGRSDDAAAVYQRAIDIDPHFQPARDSLRQLHP